MDWAKTTTRPDEKYFGNWVGFILEIYRYVILYFAVWPIVNKRVQSSNPRLVSFNCTNTPTPTPTPTHPVFKMYVPSCMSSSKARVRITRKSISYISTTKTRVSDFRDLMISLARPSACESSWNKFVYQDICIYMYVLMYVRMYILVSKCDKIWIRKHVWFCLIWDPSLWVGLTSELIVLSSPNHIVSRHQSPTSLSLCVGESHSNGAPLQRLSNTESTPMKWHHHGLSTIMASLWTTWWRHYGNIFRVTGHWRGAFMFSLICTGINRWVNNREAGDLRRYRAYYDVIVRNYGISIVSVLVTNDCAT